MGAAASQYSRVDAATCALTVPRLTGCSFAQDSRPDTGRFFAAFLHAALESFWVRGHFGSSLEPDKFI